MITTDIMGRGGGSKKCKSDIIYLNRTLTKALGKGQIPLQKLQEGPCSFLIGFVSRPATPARSANSRI